jgi:hypothetical protein
MTMGLFLFGSNTNQNNNQRGTAKPVAGWLAEKVAVVACSHNRVYIVTTQAWDMDLCQPTRKALYLF